MSHCPSLIQILQAENRLAQAEMERERRAAQAREARQDARDAEARRVAQ